MRRLTACVVFGAFIACSKSDVPPPARASAAPPTAAVASAPGCPPTGLWAECSIVYRLERAGLAPHVDSSAKPSEKALTGTPIVINLGLTATLEVFLYPDSAARLADARNLDRTALVNDTAQQTIKRERTLIETSNLIGLLTSINAHQRERVSDALTAGAPHPSEPVKLPPSKP